MVCRKLAVLFKIVPDPEGVFKMDANGGLPGKDLPQIPSVFDENAVEAAVLIKETTNCKVTVVCVGQPGAEPMLRRTLAMGADEAILIEADIGWDSLGAARVLAAALKQLGGFDVVLCGREAADTGAGLVGPYVAQALGMPFLTLAQDIKVVQAGLEVKRPCDGGHDVFVCRPPILLTVTAEANRPRMPSVMKMLKVKNIPIRRLAMDPQTAPALPGPAKAQVLARSTPSFVGQCEFLEGATAADKASALMEALRAAGGI